MIARKLVRMDVDSSTSSMISKVINVAAERLKDLACRFTQFGDNRVNRQIAEVVTVSDTYAGKVSR